MMKTYEFQDIQPRSKFGRPVPGILISGIAELEPSDEANIGTFCVTSVLVDGGNPISLTYANARPGTFDAVIFKAVADEIENDLTHDGKIARALWADAVEQDAQDAIDEDGDRRFEFAGRR
jgi:hypothetical protein